MTILAAVKNKPRFYFSGIFTEMSVRCTKHRRDPPVEDTIVGEKSLVPDHFIGPGNGFIIIQLYGNGQEILVGMRILSNTVNPL
jgi:hypothetical protein